MPVSSTQMHENGTPEIFVAYAWEIQIMSSSSVAGWSSLVARQAHNLKVAGSNPVPAIKKQPPLRGCFFVEKTGS